jgi:ABC-type nitrate/sulfonate/bicarbonate transport system substrate-binding protein
LFLRIKYIYYLILTAAVCCVLLGGCKQKKPTGFPEKVTIATTNSIHAVLIKIAEANGFFREEGLDVSLQIHSTGNRNLLDLLDGKADLAIATDTPIMFAMMKGSKFSMLATIETSTRDVAILARKDRGVKSVADLRGRKIGVPLGSSGDYSLDSYLTLQGMARKDLEIVDMKPEEMPGALLQGRVDAVSIWNPFITSLRTELGERGIVLHSDSAYKETTDVVSMQAFARQRPEAIRRFLRALVKAEDFVFNNPQESQRIISEFCGMDIGSLTSIWDDFQFNVSLNQSLLLNLENQTRWAIKNGITDRSDLPNFFEALYTDGLNAVKPDALRIIK